MFVEWSAANKFVQDVNYPSQHALRRRAERRRADVRHAGTGRQGRQDPRGRSADSRSTAQFFVDNAVRKDGKLQVTRNRSEVCQYFAFFFDVATPQDPRRTVGALCATSSARTARRRRPSPRSTWPTRSSATCCAWNCSRVPAAASRSSTNRSPTCCTWPSGPARCGKTSARTASCNHGFASHIVHTLYRDVLGLYRVDTVNKTVRVRFGDLKLDRCEGRVPTPHGPVELRWHKEGDRLLYRLDVTARLRGEDRQPERPRVDSCGSSVGPVSPDGM